jgi:hypothetical protein
VRGLLVRVGVDLTFGGWNAPVDPDTGAFVYVSIPEDARFARGMATPYRGVAAPLRAFGGVALPGHLRRRNMHLDPDFARLSYGDRARRGRDLARFERGDVVVFYAGLRPVRPCAHRLVYALVGVYRVDDVVRAGDVPRARHRDNAHTRRARIVADDVIVRGQPGSGRLGRCLPIGEWRDGAYRVRRDVLAAWGGLSCRDGYLQRSAVPPRLLDPPRFLRWLDAQRVELLAANNP